MLVLMSSLSCTRAQAWCVRGPQIAGKPYSVEKAIQYQPILVRGCGAESLILRYGNNLIVKGHTQPSL